MPRKTDTAEAVISTHDLTRRSTAEDREADIPDLISTHDLTRRSTVVRSNIVIGDVYFNSRPHKEVDL